MSDVQHPATSVGGSRQPSDISIAVLHPGNRIEVMAEPLRVSQLAVDIDPPDPYDRDLVICDNADRDLGKEVLKNRFSDATLIYRMRGDVFHELDLWDMHTAKHWIAERMVLPGVDACLAVSDRLAEKFIAETGVQAWSAGVWKRESEWPDVFHTTRELRAITLTNANYIEKIKPIARWAPVVDSVLDELGGRWHICGDGRHTDVLADWIDGYEHVEFAGYVDAESELGDSNIMLHPSGLDGQPNGILEGMAANLPVLTNDFGAFTQYDGPLVTCASLADLRASLRRYSSPALREQQGERGRQYIREHHSPEAIARDYERFALEVLDGQD